MMIPMTTTMIETGAAAGTDSIINHTISDGTTTYKPDLNNGQALVADREYTFVFGGARETDKGATKTTLEHNLEIETSSTIAYLDLEEIQESGR